MKNTKHDPVSDLEKRRALYAKIDRSEMNLVETIRQMRKSTGMTQAQYAKLVRVGERVYIDIERGLANPTLRTLQKILQPFGLEIAVRRIPRK